MTILSSRRVYKPNTGSPILGKGVKQMLKLFVLLQSRVMELRDRQDGQAFAEYGLLLAIVAVAMIAVLIVFKGALASAFNTVSNAL